MRNNLTSAVVLIVFGLSGILSSASADPVVFLIRHAEQVRDVEDPPLTDAGQRRAKTWASVLRDSGLKVVYTSKKRRTMQTGQPIAATLDVPLETMSRKDVQGLVDRIRAKHADDAVLIISHTRTIPKLVKAFGSDDDDGSIDRDDYDNLFVIVPKGSDDATVFRLRY